MQAKLTKMPVMATFFTTKTKIIKEKQTQNI